MTIEFRCSNCNKLLRTPDGTSGKQAKCPQCGAISTIPAASTEPSHSAQAMPPRDPDFGAASAARSSATADEAQRNPYQAPTVDQPLVAPGPTAFQPTHIELGEVLTNTWEIYKANLGMCIVGPLLTNVCASVAGGFTSALLTPLANSRNEAVVAAAGLTMFAAFVAIMAYFYLGLTKYMLTIARGQPAQIGDLFSAGPLLPVGAAVFTLLSLGTFAGMMLLFVPGVIFMLFFNLAPFVLVERKAGVLDCFRLSAAAMQGNKLTAFVLMLVIGFIAMPVVVLTCGLGGIFTAPFFWLAYAVVYLTASGQPTALEPVYPGSERTFGAPGTQPSF